MGFIKHIAAPIRRLVRFPLFQLAVVVALILWLQAASENSAAGHVFSGLDKLVDATVQLFHHPSARMPIGLPRWATSSSSTIRLSLLERWNTVPVRRRRMQEQ